MHKTVALFLVLLLAACAREQPASEAKTNTSSTTVPVIMAASTKAGPSNVNQEPQEALRQTLDNVDPRPLWFLKDDLFGLLFVSERDVRLRVRMQVCDTNNTVIADETQDVQVWRQIPAQVQLPVRYPYAIPAGERRVLSIRLRVLSQDRAEDVRFRVYLSGFQISRPKSDESGATPSLPRDEPQPDNNDPKGTREF